MVHILDIFVSIAMSTILFLAGCSDKAVKDNEGNGGSDNEGDEPVETEYLQLYPAPGNLAQNVIGMDHIQKLLLQYNIFYYFRVYKIYAHKLQEQNIRH